MAGISRVYGYGPARRSHETTWRRLLDATEQPSGIVAVDTNNRIVGFAHYLFHRSTWADEGYCYLEDLFVDPDGRGSGAGRVLILAVEAVAREKGCQEMYLTTEDSNATARALYDKVMSKTPFIEYRTVLK